MIRTVRRLAATAVLASLALGAAACGGDDDSSTEPTSSASGSSVPGTPSADSSSETSADPTSPSSAAVSPAAGPELRQTVVAVNAPTGWELGSAPAGFSSAADGPGRTDTLLLVDNASLAGPDATIDDLYQSFVDLSKGDKKLTYERLPDLDLQGTPASYVHSTRKGDKDQTYDVTAIRGDRVVSLTFHVAPRTLENDPQLVESVLASLRWLD